MNKKELSKQYADERRIPDESRANVQFNCFELQQAYEDGYDKAVELACEWLDDVIDNGMWIANDVGLREKIAIIEYFKERMEEGV